LAGRTNNKLELCKICKYYKLGLYKICKNYNTVGLLATFCKDNYIWQGRQNDELDRTIYLEKGGPVYNDNHV